MERYDLVILRRRGGGYQRVESGGHPEGAGRSRRSGAARRNVRQPGVNPEKDLGKVRTDSPAREGRGTLRHDGRPIALDWPTVVRQQHDIVKEFQPPASFAGGRGFRGRGRHHRPGARDPSRVRCRRRRLPEEDLRGPRRHLSSLRGSVPRSPPEFLLHPLRTMTASPGRQRRGRARPAWRHTERCQPRVVIQPRSSRVQAPPRRRPTRRPCSIVGRRGESSVP